MVIERAQNKRLNSAERASARLFFRYHNARRLIIYAWVNDANTKRTYGSSSDAYAVFRKMVESGNPPNDWTKLEVEASCPAAAGRLTKAKALQVKK
jgi:toxin YhaV